VASLSVFIHRGTSQALGDVRCSLGDVAGLYTLVCKWCICSSNSGLTHRCPPIFGIFFYAVSIEGHSTLATRSSSLLFSSTSTSTESIRLCFFRSSLWIDPIHEYCSVLAQYCKK
jgi:hypothetical protein